MTDKSDFDLMRACEMDAPDLAQIYGLDHKSWPALDNAPELPARSDDLDRIIWKGRQWAVTAYGIERCDGKYYAIRKDTLVSGRGYSWIQHMGEKGWVDMPDFAAALGVAFLFHRHDGGQKA